MGRGATGRRGTGEDASIRAGFRMIGRDMGAPPTCRGRGCRMRGDWLLGEGPRDGDGLTGGGVSGEAAGTGEARSVPEERGRG